MPKGIKGFQKGHPVFGGIETRFTSESMRGKKNPRYGKRPVDPFKKGNTLGSAHKGRKVTWGDKISKSRKGKCAGDENPSWIDGRSYEPYPKEFKRIRKEKTISERDNFTCQLCGDYIPEFKGHKNKLSIHHIDYDKKNNNLNNLISLCNFCNSSVNKNREDWTQFFREVLSK
ncbi:MAG: hypothetical protein IH948_00220 [Bacteroidetes bacterium]|nr:hypothetical protein [Bacteroidota bacterium]